MQIENPKWALHTFDMCMGMFKLDLDSPFGRWPLYDMQVVRTPAMVSPDDREISGDGIGFFVLPLQYSLVYTKNEHTAMTVYSTFDICFSGDPFATEWDTKKNFIPMKRTIQMLVTEGLVPNIGLSYWIYMDEVPT